MTFRYYSPVYLNSPSEDATLIHKVINNTHKNTSLKTDIVLFYTHKHSLNPEHCPDPLLQQRSVQLILKMEPEMETKSRWSCCAHNTLRTRWRNCHLRMCFLFVSAFSTTCVLISSHKKYECLQAILENVNLL